MPIDGCFIHYLTNEINQEIKNYKINKIYQTSNLDVLLQLRGKNDNGLIVNKQLFLSSSLDTPKFYLTKKKFQNPEIPSSFCMLLRKYIDRGIITNVSQVDNDRIIEIHILATNELDDEQQFVLLIELMGRNSNIVLKNNDGYIIDAIRKIPPTHEFLRTIIPKAKYVYPEATKTVNPFNLDDSEEPNVNSFQGVSKLLCDVLKEKSPKEIKDFLNQKLDPVIYFNGKKKDCYVFNLSDENSAHYPTICEMLDEYYSEGAKETNSSTNYLSKVIKKELSKNTHKLANLNDDLEKARENLIYNDYGILLQTNFYLLKKGQSEITVENFLTDNSMITIKLNPLKDPRANLALIFNKARKAKTSLSETAKQKEICEKEILYLETLLFQISIANNDEIENIKDEITKLGYIKSQSKFKNKNKKISFDKMIVDDHEILIGKCNTQNEALTHTIGLPNDYWFHAKDIPGSHVIVRCKKDEVLSEAVIRAASNAAAYFSKAKSSSSVPVDYTRVRYIKKIPGQKGYHVTYTNQKTIYIDPTKDNLVEIKKAIF